ncbi:3'-5' exoribonuclease HELZ2-like [Glandiceps talaboti]
MGAYSFGYMGTRTNKLWKDTGLQYQGMDALGHHNWSIPNANSIEDINPEDIMETLSMFKPQKYVPGMPRFSIGPPLTHVPPVGPPDSGPKYRRYSELKTHLSKANIPEPTDEDLDEDNDIDKSKPKYWGCSNVMIDEDNFKVSEPTEGDLYDDKVDESWLPDTMLNQPKQGKKKKKNRKKKSKQSAQSPSVNNTLSEDSSSNPPSQEPPPTSQSPPIASQREHCPSSSDENEVTSGATIKPIPMTLETPSRVVHATGQPLYSTSDGDDNKNGSEWRTVRGKKSYVNLKTGQNSEFDNFGIHTGKGPNQCPPIKPGIMPNTQPFRQQLNTVKNKSVSVPIPIVPQQIANINNLPMPIQQMLQTHDFALVCRQCYTKIPGLIGQGSDTLNVCLKHKCLANILLACKKINRVHSWKKIRPILNKRYPGKYYLCNEYTNEEECSVHEDRCYYGHSEEEIQFWTMERKHKLKRDVFFSYLKCLPGLKTCQDIGEGDGQVSGTVASQTAVVGDPLRRCWSSAENITTSKSRKGSACHSSNKMNGSVNVVTANRPEGQMRQQWSSTENLAPTHTLSNSSMNIRSIVSQPYATSHVSSEFKLNASQERLMKLLLKCEGQFVFCCKECFHKSSKICLKVTGDTSQHCTNRHPWEANKMMMHFKQDGDKVVWSKIGHIHPKVAGRVTQFTKCKHAFHKNIPNINCTFAHSDAEKAVWELEAVAALTREQIVAASSIYVDNLKMVPAANQRVSALPAAPIKPQVDQSLIKTCPFQIKIVCKECWRSNQLHMEDGQHDGRCTSKDAHRWTDDNKEILVSIKTKTNKKWVPVNCIPKCNAQTNQTTFRMCRHAWLGKDHFKRLKGRDCMNAHSPEEMALWKWQSQTKVLTLQALIQNEKQGTTASKQVPTPEKRSEQNAVKTPLDLARSRPEGYMQTPLELARSRPVSYYCDYCYKHCNSNLQFEQHCASPGHKIKVISDKDREHEWQHRSPPWRVHEDALKMCSRWRKQPNSCLYSECTFAHGQEELDEWKERTKYRQMKMKMAKERHLYSFLDTLLDKYNDPESNNDVIKESIPDVKIETSSKLVTALVKSGHKSKCRHTWLFKLSSEKMQLVRVGLLHDLNRQHFYLSPGNGKLQIASGSRFATEDGDYQISVTFESQIFGSFHQWAVFDFDSEPLLVQKLTAHVGSTEELEKISKAEHQTVVKAWNSENSNIIKHSDDIQDNFSRKVMKKYKDPSTFQEQTLQIRESTLSQKNYRHLTHRLLNIEELAQMKILESLSCKTTITVSKSITIESSKGDIQVFAPDKELYSKVGLQKELSDDHDAGRLVLRSVNTILIKPCWSKSKVVYEARVLSDEDHSGREKQAICIHLSERCCRDLDLKADQQIDVEIQFRLDRLPFCRQHYAVDKVSDEVLGVIFPLVKSLPAVKASKPMTVPGLKMNVNQCQALASIVNKNHPKVSPLVIYGPFGTGKTFTIANSVKQLVTKQPKARVLICTMSNSAADLYITSYFHPWVESGQSGLKPLRMYSGSRRLQLINPTVAKYCPLQEVKAGFKRVRLPTVDDVAEIKKHAVVITTLTSSVVFERIGLRGHFTHILIDEAGQALESEAITPLTLATPNTKIVLAGDHRQMSTEVYSDYAKTHKFCQSLLKRLYGLYMECGDGSELYRLMLVENYRCNDEILKFVSKLYYGKQLIASSDPPQQRHPDVYPLAFFSANGKEELVGTSYFNEAEVLELTYRVEWLSRNWPKEWGSCDMSTVGVLSPYASQVQQIRSHLRKRSLGGVNVGGVLTVQGNEFRALFISTVRTRQVLEDEDNVSDLNLGFLTDRKLLNTALTRAQSLVVVVGDPIALCSIGKCSGDWRKFISECEKHQSVYPETLTMESIQQQVLSTRVQLDPKAADFVPGKKSVKQKKRQEKQPSNSGDGTNVLINKPLYSAVGRTDVGLNGSNSSANNSNIPRGKSPVQHMSLSSQLRPADGIVTVHGLEGQNVRDIVTKPVVDYANDVSGLCFLNESLLDNDEWESDDEQDVLDKLDLDEILQELGRQLSITRQQSHKEDMCDDMVDIDEESHDDGPSWPSTDPLPKAAEKKQRQKRQRLGHDHDEDYDSDEDEDCIWNPYEDENLETTESCLIREYAKDELEEMVRSQADLYKRCKLYLELKRCYAVTLDGDKEEEIEITTKLKRGRALNNDEVVVEILESNEESNESQDDDKKVYGKVIGIWNRAVEPRLLKIACTIDEYTNRLMTPLNRTLPKMIWICPGDANFKLKRPTNHIPICQLTKGGDLNLKDIEVVTNKNRPHKVFVVRYLHWAPQFRYPICVVIDVLPPGDTLATGTAILKMAYGVKETYKKPAKQEAARLYPDNWKIPPSEYKHRLDLRDLDVFTVDPVDSKDLDDAVSVEWVDDDNNYKVGIHIADVAFFVHPDSELDKEALRRTTSHYPWNQTPVHMLPAQLSTRLCSLLQGKDRLALTVFVRITESGEVSDQRIHRSIIRSKARLSYEEAEKVITGASDSCVPENIMKCILTLHQLASELRQHRLGDARHCLDYDDDDTMSSPSAHIMIEELMLLANMRIASLLKVAYPQCTPLRCQVAPKEDKLSEWKTKHRHQIQNCLSMATKSELLQLQEFLLPEVGSNIDVLNTVWEQIVVAVQLGNIGELKKLLLTDQNHPQLAVMVANYQQIQQRSTYVCSNSTIEGSGHFSLNVPEYTHFTSPIRRYIDIIVHRLVIASLTCQNAPISQNEVMNICNACNLQATYAKEFERATMALYIATRLKEKPIRTLAFVKSTSDGNMSVHLQQCNKQVPPSQRSLRLSVLQPSEKPIITEDNDPLTVKWKGRIYMKTEGEEESQSTARVKRMETAVLSPERYVKHIPFQLWQELLACTLKCNKPKLISLVNQISFVLNNRQRVKEIGLKSPTGYCVEVMSGGCSQDRTNSNRHFCQFQRTYSCGEVMEVQLCTEMRRGVLTPTVQQFNVTPKLDICLEHRGKPVTCFAEIAGERTAALKSKRTIADYQRVWKNLVSMVTANSAVTAGETVVIHNIGIQWSNVEEGDKSFFEGIFRLPVQFCMDKQVKFHGAKIEDKDPDTHYGFVCVRYQINDSTVVQTKCRKNEGQTDRPHGYTWTGHCATTAVERNKEFIEVHMKLNQTSTPIPPTVLRQSRKDLLQCTIEWIPKTMPDRRVGEALEKLTRASNFVKDICLGRKITKEGRMLKIKHICTEIQQRRPFFKLNDVQDTAVKTALCQPFTVIQGPPGTGKTVTGVHIAYWFVQANKQAHIAGGTKKQVMYCGPSNKSVDVVTGYLKRIPNLEIVRVYSESIERHAFPIPGVPEYPLRNRETEITMSHDHEDVALHYRIRQSTNPNSREIKGYDTLFRDPEYSPELKEVQKYRGLIADAEKFEFEKSDIILCTCVTAGGRRIASGTRIHQCIIDECGMCTEPETIVPMVTTDPKQIVLVGDHKQLRAIVTEDMAKSLGMEISMLERYQLKALMLTLQYRMHPGICSFPSDHFYDSRLRTADSVLRRPQGLDIWPGGRCNPTVFGHIVGSEEVLTVSTSEGGEMSRSNPLEAEEVVRIALTLLVRYHVNPASVIILSQYRAQCAEITKLLETKGHRDIAVSTVIVSQGSEWDYVIFSTVRSLPGIEIEERPSQGWLRSNLGFITDEHQINVAITRAKHGLIIVGNQELLRTHLMWKNLLKKYEDDGCIVNAQDFLRLQV